MEHWTEIISALAGAGAYGLVAHLTRRRDVGDDLNETAVRYLRDEMDTLRNKLNLVESYNAQHVQKIAGLERENDKLKMRNEVLNAFPFNLPLPMWSVDWRHCYDYVNQRYEEIFLKGRGITADDAIGKNLHEVWPDEVARMFVANNQRVMDEDLIMNDIEDVPDSLGHNVSWRILKVKRPYPLGVIGIAIPRNGMFDKMLRKIQK